VKIFQVQDEDVSVVECVLNSLSRKPEGTELDCFVFSVVYEDGKYGVGYYQASPADMAKIAGYIQLDANLRYVKMNKEELDEEDEDNI
jgi:hypothetical protein